MRKPIIHAALGLLGITFAATGASAQAILETDKVTIELVGLRRWTIPMIQDSLAKYSPANQLTAHACAAILRGKLHFADASVQLYRGIPNRDSKDYTVITLVEPQDSSRIHYYPAIKDSMPARADYKDAFAAFRANSELAQTALQTPSFYDRRLSPADSAKFEKLAPMHAIIESKRTPADLASALRTLETDGSVTNRVIAVLVVSNFMDADSAWWTLADAQRDQIGIVTGTASQILGAMSRRTQRAVDWRPIADKLRYLVDGTNLFAFDGTLRLLAASKVDPSLAPTLLGGGGSIVRAKLRSKSEGGRTAAVQFLAQLSGLPATSAPEAFEEWMAKLETRSR